MVEKFDDQRLRFKRPASARANDASLAFDPYRTQYGISVAATVGIAVSVAVLIAIVIIAAVIGGVAILTHAGVLPHR